MTQELADFLQKIQLKREIIHICIWLKLHAQTHDFLNDLKSVKYENLKYENKKFQHLAIWLKFGFLFWLKIIWQGNNKFISCGELWLQVIDWINSVLSVCTVCTLYSHIWNLILSGQSCKIFKRRKFYNIDELNS